MTPEGKIKKLVKDLLAKYDVFYYMPIPSGFGGTTGIPDFCGVRRGLAFFVETKAPGGKLTALQKQKKELIEAAGGTWFLVDGPESLCAVQKWLETT